MFLQYSYCFSYVILSNIGSYFAASPFWSIAMHPENMHFSVGSGDGKVGVSLSTWTVM